MDLWIYVFMDLSSVLISFTLFNFQSRMTKTTVNKRKRVTVKLNPLTVKRMVHDIIKNVYGPTTCGQFQYHFNDTAMKSLLQSAESFLEDMWEQTRQLTHNNVVTVQHIRLWKRETDFKLRFKKNNLSLCEIFKHHFNK